MKQKSLITVKRIYEAKFFFDSVLVRVASYSQSFCGLISQNHKSSEHLKRSPIRSLFFEGIDWFIFPFSAWYLALVYSSAVDDYQIYQMISTCSAIFSFLLLTIVFHSHDKLSFPAC